MTEYRYEDRGYRDRENYYNDEIGSKWGALLSLLLIPLIAVGGYFAWNAYRNNRNTAYSGNGVVSPIYQKLSGPSPTQGLKVGVGGAPASTITPTVSSEVSNSSRYNPGVTTDNTDRAADNATVTSSSTITQGVGASSGLPNGAPNSGLGGATGN